MRIFLVALSVLLALDLGVIEIASQVTSAVASHGDRFPWTNAKDVQPDRTQPGACGLSQDMLVMYKTTASDRWLIFVDVATGNAIFVTMAPNDDPSYIWFVTTDLGTGALTVLKHEKADPVKHPGPCPVLFAGAA